MRIAVLVKEVPDTYGDRELNAETGLTARDTTDRVIDEICERAVEVALTHADSRDDVEVVAVVMAPEDAMPTVRKALALGAARAVHIVDEELVGADLRLSAEVLAAAIRRVDADLVLAGGSSTDGGGGVIPAMLGDLLDLPVLDGANSVEIGDGEVRGEVQVDTGTATARAALPAIVAITERLPEARFPNFKGIMAAKKKPVETVSLSELQVAASVDGRSIMLTVAERPPRGAGTIIVDEGDGGERIAAYLTENRVV